MKKAKPVVRSDALSNRELALIADSLATAADEFADRSCNDFLFPVTPENRRIGEAIVRFQDADFWTADSTPADFLAAMAANDRWVCVYDNWAAHYFANLCGRLAAAEPAGSLSAAELTIAADLLESSADDHESWYADHPADIDLTLASTDEHRSLIAAAIEQQAPRGWKAKLAELAKGTAPLSLPDFQLMRYLAARCKALAAVTDTAPATGIVTRPSLPPAQELIKPGTVPNIEPLGIRPQFKPVKSYLKSYIRGFDDDEYQRKLRNLERYAAEGEGFIYGPDILPGQPMRFNFSSAFLELVGVYWVTRWFAVQAALGGKGTDWQLLSQRSAAYGYWAHRMDLERRTRSTSLKNMLTNAANCLVLGWEDWAVDLAHRVYVGLDEPHIFFEYSDLRHPRTHIFVLRLFADWQGWPRREWKKWVFDEPIYNGLIEHWRTPDPDALKPLLVAACDRHTHQSRYGGSTTYDIDSAGFWYDPFEVLAVMKLRQLLGLDNPIMEHILLDTPLGKLPEPVAPYSDAFLERILARLRLTRPGY